MILGMALLPGCGGSDSSATEVHRAPAAERTRFIAAADPVCREAVKEIQALRPAPATSGGNALTPFTEGLVRPGIPILTREANRLRAIQPRPDDSDLQRYLGLFDPILVLADQRLRLGETKNPSPEKARTIETDIQGLEEAQATYAKSFGFKVCGTGFFAAITSNPSG